MGNFEFIEVYHGFVKNIWYALSVSFGCIAYSRYRHDKYQKYLFITSLAFTISAFLLTMRLIELINSEEEEANEGSHVDLKLKIVAYIFFIFIAVLTYISFDGFIKKI